MTHATTNHPASSGTPMGWLRRAEAWLDDKGKGAWIAAMVLGFIFAWPVGLFLLFYMIWGKKMFSKQCKNRSHHHSARAAAYAMKSSGNSAFDAYKAETLRRLEEEQGSFEAFLERLRAAKDKNEFDQFMEDRVKTAADESASVDTEADEQTKQDA